MGKKLAIKGHATRGKEVIELLEMLGGKNIHNLYGNNSFEYYVSGHAILNDRLSIIEDDDFVIFNLEEFLEKYPFKVGDKVHIYVQNDDIDGRYDIEATEITSMRWNPARCKIAYKMKDINREFYKEEIKCKVDDSDKPTKTIGKKLAIRGHSTRGKEVIEILEMMGGHATIIKEISNETDKVFFNSDNENCFHRKSIRFIPDSSKEIEEFTIFTLEEFLEKFPFKIHDLVNIPEYESTVGICGMRWDPYSKHMEYMVYRCDDEEWYTANELLDYNDNPNETPKNKEEKKINQMSLANCDLDEVEIVLGDKFELKIEDGKYYAVRKKLTYPINYLECREILGENAYYGFSVFTTLQNLIICRNAYWKIAGEQMGLGKPWEPDWDNLSTNHEFIKIDKGCFTYSSRVLVFPTEEMRDAFYDNFKDLIEQCKELL